MRFVCCVVWCCVCVVFDALTRPALSSYLVFCKCPVLLYYPLLFRPVMPCSVLARRCVQPDANLMDHCSLHTSQTKPCKLKLRSRLSARRRTVTSHPQTVSACIPPQSTSYRQFRVTEDRFRLQSGCDPGRDTVDRVGSLSYDLVYRRDVIVIRAGSAICSLKSGRKQYSPRLACCRRFGRL